MNTPARFSYIAWHATSDSWVGRESIEMLDTIGLPGKHPIHRTRGININVLQNIDKLLSRLIQVN